ncbi:hypothetical protein [Novosphingobium gossypii]
MTRLALGWRWSDPAVAAIIFIAVVSDGMKALDFYAANFTR